MATTRPFAYNPGSAIPGTEQVGSIAYGLPTAGFVSTGLEWWNGPDEDLGYVIAQPVSGNTQPTPVPDDNITLSSTYKGADISLSNNNQTAAQIFGYQQSVLGETIISGTNQVMFSVLSTPLEPLTLPQSRFIGVGKTTMNYQGDPYGGYPGNDTQSIGFNAIGEYYYNGSVVQSGLPTWTDSDIIDIAISHGQGWFIRVNGGYWNNNPAANPATLTGYLSMNGLTNFYPTLCPGYEGTMTILNYPKYGVPSTYNFLGNVTASVGFFRSDALTEGSFIDLADVIAGPSGGGPFASANSAKSWLNSNGYWTSFGTGTGGTGFGFNLVQFPYNFPAAGNSIMNQTGGATSGGQDPNGLTGSARGFYFNMIDDTGTDRSSYYSTFLGQNVTITLSQNGNSAVYTGNTGAFKQWISEGATGYVFGTGIGVPPSGTPSGTATLVQASPSQFSFGSPVYVTLSLT